VFAERLATIEELSMDDKDSGSNGFVPLVTVVGFHHAR
jgi:hypothetical protein